MSIRTIQVYTSPAYQVSIGPGLLSTCGDALRELMSPCRMALITDALAVAAAGDDAEAFDPRVIIEDGVCKLSDRSALAGSIATMDRLIRTAVQQAFIPLEDACRMVSETPAHIMGCYDRKGSLSRGKDADILILDHDLNVRMVWQMGKVIENTLF